MAAMNDYEALCRACCDKDDEDNSLDENTEKEEEE
jgi:hypothetical protein